MGKTKYIFVTGGVLSGVGKGVAAASIGALFKARGYTVSIQKCDPYLNVDAGTLNPAEHGECFVTHDGAETDLDLGHYERFLDIETSRDSITLSGELLQRLIADERAGKYLGKTVQLVPHLTDAIQKAIRQSAKGSDIHIVEIGGTVGDYEGLSFIEAIREFGQAHPGDCAYVHVVYIPFLQTSREYKTKPAQNAIRELRGFGIFPDVLLARVEEEPDEAVGRKLSVLSGVSDRAVAVLPNADTVLRVPLTLHEKQIDSQLEGVLGLPKKPVRLAAWKSLVARATTQHAHAVTIGIVAKYLDNEDSYLSVIEALKAAAWQHDTRVDYQWIDAGDIEKNGTAILAKFDGIIVPGGFGVRGVEGKIMAARFALDTKLPYLGLCLGLQVAVIAAARKGGLDMADSSECDPETKQAVVYIMKEQRGKEATGGTMRLGNYSANLLAGSCVAKAYKATSVIERHRHRYEVNRAYEDVIERGGLVISGQSPDGKLVEFVEGKDHPFFVATQAHPEYRSRPMRPHPLFVAFVHHASKR